MNLPRRITAGIIGCGTVAGYGHIPAMVGDTDTECTALADIDPARLQYFKERYAVPHCFTDYHDLLAMDEIEYVTVAVRVEDHYRIVMDALAAGKHVFCEKPLADTVEKSREMVEFAKAQGLLLGVNFEMRAYESQRRMRQLIQDKAIGDVKVLRLVSLSGGPGHRATGEKGQARLKRLSNEGGGTIFDCGVHLFDQARWLLGSDFRSVSATGTNMRGYWNPDHVIATCEMTDGTLVLIEESWIYATNSRKLMIHARQEAIGTEGVVSVSMEGDYEKGFHHHTFYTGLEEFQEWDDPSAKPFHKQYEDFDESIRQGRLINVASGEDGLRAMEAALAALKSAKEHLVPSE